MWCKGGLIKRCCSGVNRGGGSSGSRGAIDAFWKTRRRSCIFYWTLPGSSEKSRENNANAKKILANCTDSEAHAKKKKRAQIARTDGRIAREERRFARGD